MRGIESLAPVLRNGALRWQERAAESPHLSAALAALAPDLAAELVAVVAASEFVAAALLQDPVVLQSLTHPLGNAAARALNSDYAAQVGAAISEDAARKALRTWRRRAMARIAWHAITGRADVVTTLHELSDLADACIQAAAAAASRHLAPVFGTACNTRGERVPLIVVAMGKLGGRELNFSSDVDLVLLFAEAGQSNGPRSVDNQEYFQRLAREIVRYLDERTEDGFVFRVDLRLRPFGDSGPLVVSLAALEDYLQQHGRDWERYAWIKARVIVAPQAFEATWRDYVRPFVYRRYLDYGVFESLRDMKALIAREVARRELEGNLKLGAGGIRELEFIVQSFQLVRGGSDRYLQSNSLLAVLPLLAGAKYLPQEVVDSLASAYLVLRQAENAVQMLRDQQVHRLPDSDVDRERLALMHGAGEWPAVLAAIENARQCVAREFAALGFGAASAINGQIDAEFDIFASDDGTIGAELIKLGFAADAAATLAPSLRACVQGAAIRKLDDAGRRRLQFIIARVLAATVKHAQPVVIVERILRLLDAIGARSSYLALLKEQPAALERLIDVCAISGFLARQIAEFPLLLDELIDPRGFEELPSRDSFARELAARTGRLPADDPERQVEGLRQFQKAAIFTVALADQTGRLPLMKVSDRLTDIAELIVARCMDLAWQQMVALYGTPQCGPDSAHLRAVHVAVAGYGKLGGLELGYGSDLDLVFLHDSAGEIAETRGARPLDNVVFFLRLGQRIVHLLTMHSAAGRLYDVDMRLRPNGKGGFLITGIDAFETYQHENAWTWEHQALLRARAVAGDPALCARFEAVRRRALTFDVRLATLRTDVMEMRARMRRELSEADSGQFDLKQDAGGIADIEFLVQYWVLAEAHRNPCLIEYSDNIRQLEALARSGVVPESTALWLIDTYRLYRGALHRLSLEGGGERVVAAGEFAAPRARVQEIWQATFAQA
jgi:[glutamine synthetase] adenylyltransferase / [glutamine synthetase]-adenylyl-L-tyrosine phosphorylase